jgi:hypothetical protein
VALADAGPPGAKLGNFTTLRCKNTGPGKTPPERCDHVMFFEDALARAVRENQSCAPSSKSPMTVSYLMDTDFQKKKLNVSLGKSTTLKSKQSRELLKCIKRALPTPDWGTIPHQYTFYKVSVIATYPPGDAADRQ